MRKPILIFIPLVLIACGVFTAARLRHKIFGASVESRLAEFGAEADARWKPFFERTGVSYPAMKCTFVALKDAKVLEVYATGGDGGAHFVRSMPILAASGGAGPKLRQGDRQVPEGVYAVESLNPRSLFHVALRVNYPNDEDRAHGQTDGREKLGGDIMIHGGDGSVGCLAMGDEGAEDLFTLVARAGIGNITLLFCPTDFRKNPGFAPPPGAPAWCVERYADLKARMPAR